MPRSLPRALPVLVPLLAPLPAALLSPGPAEALSLLHVDFETAAQIGPAVIAPGLTARPLAPEGLPPGLGGGALRLETLPLAPDGPSGRALSTRDLAVPYGFALEFDAPASAVSGWRLAANVPWRLEARDADGVLRAAVELAPEADRFAVTAPEGILRLEFRSLGGWDWLLIDGLALAPIPAAEPPPPALVPLPAAAPLLSGALALGLWLGRRLRRMA